VETKISILYFISRFLILVFFITALLVLLIKLMSVALRRKKKMNIRKTFVILYPVLLASSIFLIFFGLDYKTPPQLDLGNSFQYLQEGRDLDYSGYAGDGIFVYHNFKGVPVIFPKVEKYAFDSIYITVKQKYHNKNSTELMSFILTYGFYDGRWGIDTNFFPVYDSVMYHDYKKFYEKGKNTYRAEHYADSVVSNNPYFIEMRKSDYNYYIIEKHKNEKHGPLSRKEFEDKFISFGLNPNLWIDE